MSKEIYKQEIEKQAALGAIGATAAKFGAKALAGAKGFTGLSAGKRMLAGSAAGGVLGAATHDSSSGKSRLSSAVGGAIGGASVGSMVNKGNVNTVKGIYNNAKNGIANWKPA